VLRIEPLPGEQEAHEISRTHRLDLGAETIERVAVDPGQEPTITPLERSGTVGRRCKLAPEHHSLALQCG
jgi:hypothetical protein